MSEKLVIPKIVLRKDINNKSKWVFEVYFDGRRFPNIISARYRNKTRATEASQIYLESGWFSSNGDDFGNDGLIRRG